MLSDLIPSRGHRIDLLSINSSELRLNVKQANTSVAAEIKKRNHSSCVRLDLWLYASYALRNTHTHSNPIAGNWQKSKSMFLEVRTASALSNVHCCPFISFFFSSGSRSWVEIRRITGGRGQQTTKLKGHGGAAIPSSPLHPANWPSSASHLFVRHW